MHFLKREPFGAVHQGLLVLMYAPAAMNLFQMILFMIIIDFLGY